MLVRDAPNLELDMTIRRRDLLTGTVVALVSERLASADVVSGKLPWNPDSATPPQPVKPGPWEFFTAEEAATVEALVDRLIPPDAQTPGGKDAGCAVFIDRQLTGGYGHQEGLYNLPPFHDGIEQQGPQSPKGPADMYRAAIAALNRYCRTQSQNGQNSGAFDTLPVARQDEILRGLESKAISLEGAMARSSSSCYSRTPCRVSLPILFTAAIATCARGR